MAGGHPPPRTDPDPAPLAQLTAGCFSLLESSRFPARVLPPASNCKFHEATALGRGRVTGKPEEGSAQTGIIREQPLSSLSPSPPSSKVGFDLLFGGGRFHIGDFVFEKKK